MNDALIQMFGNSHGHMTKSELLDILFPPDPEFINEWRKIVENSPPTTVGMNMREVGLANKGKTRVFSDEHKKNLSLCKIGVPHSIERCKQRSLSMTGKKRGKYKARKAD